MSDLFLLSEDQMVRISAFFPLSHGLAVLMINGLLAALSTSSNKVC